MKILIVTPCVPYPLESGGKIRAFSLIQQLSEQHQISLLTLAHSPDDFSRLDALRSYCVYLEAIPHFRSLVAKGRDFISSILSQRPYVVLANTSKSLRARIGQIVEAEQIELIQIEELYAAANVDVSALNCPVVFDSYNREGLILERMAESTVNPVKRCYWRGQAERLNRFEQKFCSKVDAVFCVSCDEELFFKRICKRVFLVPNGAPEINSAETNYVRTDTVLFTGTLSYPPNADAALQLIEVIWPKVLLLRPSARLQIVGRTPSAQLIRAVRNAGASVELLTSVSDIEPYFATSGVLAVPLRAGGGTRIKILEAFARGLPVVATTVGAEGIEIENGRHAFIADQPDRFAAAIVELLEDSNLSRRVSGSAIELAKERYSWRDISEQCSETYSLLCGSEHCV